MPPRHFQTTRLHRVIPRLGLLATALLLAAGCAEEEVPPPNVVIVVMDTARGDRCSVMGYGRPTTPTLRRFAREATVFRDAWSPSSWTNPAHASLFTGLRPEHHGLHRENREFLLPESVTIAEILRDAGYRTGCFLDNSCLDPGFGVVQGFEKCVPMYADPGRDYPWAPETLRRALAWALQQHREGERFLLFVNNLEPHFPYTPPANVREEFVRAGTPEDVEVYGAKIGIREILQHLTGSMEIPDEILAHLSDLYDGEIRCLDDSLGILIEGLRAEGILDETVFVIASDHGENLGDHGLVEHVNSLHRSLRHVPLLIRYPPAFEGGKTVDDVVRLEDVAPTILDLCGQKTPPGLDGETLLSDLPGRVSRAFIGPPFRYLEKFAAREGVVFDPKPFSASIRAVYDGRYHLMRTSDGREELYDVAADPAETRNLAGAGGETIERLRKLLPGD